MRMPQSKRLNCYPGLQPIYFVGFAILLLASLVTTPLAAQAAQKDQPALLPITTKSPEALQLFQGGLVKLENLHSTEGMADFRRAIRLDPDFALANVMIAFESVDVAVDPAEQAAARKRALMARGKVSHGEQLVIDWLIHSSEGRIIPAIQAMNEVLSQYPDDKFLAWLGAVWVENQQQIERAIPMFEHVIQLNPDFAPPLNELGYCYARVRDFDKAFAIMRRYIELLPNESNPQDSYAEILRMAGRFDEALQHYHASLKIDPGFVSSQLGIADTYALMGEEARARAEYAVAIAHASSKSEAATWRLQEATTYVREQNWSGADQAFRVAAAAAHDNGLAVPEAEAYRMMAAYQANGNSALALLTKAEAVLQESHPLSKLARQQELALVWRERASRAAREKKLSLATAALKQLHQMAEQTHDQLVKIAYDGAAGAVLEAQGHYQDALAHLEDDSRNPVSMKLMITAYQKTGAQASAAELSAVLANLNEPTLEQALITPEFRDHQPKTAASFSRM
jgi:tetratricopeptide (TPR) repeat protein